MAIVQRANVILEIKDDATEYYLAKGYNLIDNAGRIVKEAPPTDVESFRRAYIDSQESVIALQKKVEELTKQLEKKNSKKKSE